VTAHPTPAAAAAPDRIRPCAPSACADATSAGLGGAFTHVQTLLGKRRRSARRREARRPEPPAIHPEAPRAQPLRASTSSGPH
jgi:hypothetical protein